MSFGKPGSGMNAGIIPGASEVTNDLLWRKTCKKEKRDLAELEVAVQRAKDTNGKIEGSWAKDRYKRVKFLPGGTVVLDDRLDFAAARKVKIREEDPPDRRPHLRNHKDQWLYDLAATGYEGLHGFVISDDPAIVQKYRPDDPYLTGKDIPRKALGGNDAPKFVGLVDSPHKNRRLKEITRRREAGLPLTDPEPAAPVSPKARGPKPTLHGLKFEMAHGRDPFVARDHLDTLVKDFREHRQQRKKAEAELERLEAALERKQRDKQHHSMSTPMSSPVAIPSVTMAWGSPSKSPSRSPSRGDFRRTGPPSPTRTAGGTMMGSRPGSMMSSSRSGPIDLLGTSTFIQGCMSTRDRENFKMSRLLP